MCLTYSLFYGIISYRRKRTTIFCEHLPKGKYTFEVKGECVEGGMAQFIIEAKNYPEAYDIIGEITMGFECCTTTKLKTRLLLEDFFEPEE